MKRRTSFVSDSARALLGGWFLLLLPALLLLVAFHVRDARGPYWLSENLDPSYPYLLNSLNVANLHRPFHTDHPGTPVQTAGGLLIRLSNLSSDEQATAREVLSDPEKYLRRANNLFILFYALALAASGFAALAATRRPALALLFQSAPFLSTTTILALTGLRPEPLLAALSVLVASVAVLALRHDVNEHARPFALAFGLLVGLGVACKVNFAPLALIPLAVLPRLRPRVEFCLAAAASFFFFIAPIVTPAHLRSAFGFFARVATHTGRYGGGASGFADPQQLARNAVNLVLGDWPFFTLVAASLLLLAWHALRRPRSRDELSNDELPTGRPSSDATSSPDFVPTSSPDFVPTSAPDFIPRSASVKLLLGLLAAELVVFLLVAKHPSAHYLAPALGLAGLNLLLLARALGPARSRLAALRYALPALALALVVAQGFQLRALGSRLAASAREQLAAHELAERERQGGAVVNYYSSSSLPYAIKFGTDYSNNFYGPLLDELYPGRLFWNPWMSHFSNFSGPLDADRLRAAAGGDSFVMHGYSFADSDFRAYLPPEPLPDGLRLEDLHRGDTDRPGLLDGEALYRATFTPR